MNPANDLCNISLLCNTFIMIIFSFTLHNIFCMLRIVINSRSLCISHNCPALKFYLIECMYFKHA